MKGIVLAGGTGSRLHPLTNVLNKHILPVGRYPMIYYPLHTLKLGGITDVMIVSGKEHLGTLVSQLGSGSELGMSFTYKIQDKADGVAGALKLCEDFVRTNNSKFGEFVVLLGDNIFLEKLDFNFCKLLPRNVPNAKFFITEVIDPHRFGVVKFDKDIECIVEKPKSFVSNFVVTGAYMYDQNIWTKVAELEKSNRGEFEITDVNNWYIQNGKVCYDYLVAEWTDAGTPESLLKANMLCKGVIL